MIEPVIDALTTSISPAWRAKNAMISSAMLPNVALRMPPTCGPVSDPSRSVERPTTQARPRIADRRHEEQDRLVDVQPEVEDDREQADGDGPEQEGAAERRKLAKDREARAARGPRRRRSGHARILAQRVVAPSVRRASCERNTSGRAGRSTPDPSGDDRRTDRQSP